MTPAGSSSPRTRRRSGSSSTVEHHPSRDAEPRLDRPAPCAIAHLQAAAHAARDKRLPAVGRRTTSSRKIPFKAL
ncbi:hypothetical protein DEO45_04910 [Rhodanobacter denitrificans]|uniref:Uncharacterized protein n=1 Tax=Rhodanobacter denitrificans TaxID=666685 RepID=A0A368KK62_9GAMM|nr:hypothetical protein DEO45_04910 [Rhodanobacter denitrificans]